MTPRLTAAQVLDAHPQARVVTLDFFDTLVTRSVVQPTHVFAEVERRLVAELGSNWVGYAQARVLVEHNLRVAVAGSGSVRDLSHEEIVEALRGEMSASEHEIERARVIECECEIEMATVVPFGRDIAREAHARGLRVAVVSDNYMSSTHLVKMAHAAGETWVQEGDVFVSCEHGAMKQNGTLWPLVITMLNVPAEAILHVGDHDIPDRVHPSRAGIACHIDSCSSQWNRHPMNTGQAVLAHSRIEALQRDLSFGRGVSLAESLGGAVVAMMVAAQVKDMIAVVTERDIAGVHFAARDGWMAHSVWGQHRATHHTALPEASYLSFSRSVIGRANITEVDEEVAVRFVDEHERLTVARLSQRFGCDIESSLPDGAEMDSDTARQTLVRNSTRIVEASSQLRRRVVGHLRANGLLTKGHHVVADLGWRGSTMADLADLVAEASNGESTVEGRFLGLYWDATMNRLRVPLHGYAVDDLGPLDDNIRLLGAVRLFEFLVTAPYGSVVDFSDEAQGFTPVYSERVFQSPHEEKFLTEVMTTAINSALQILSGTHPSGVGFDDITPESVWAAMMQVAHTPRPDELDALARFAHVASVDHADAGTPLIATPPSWASTIPLQWYGRIYDDTMKTRWFQGSLRDWERHPKSSDFAAGVMRLWPFMGPVWCDPS